MANTKKYVSLDKLSLYDEKIKDVIAKADAAALEAANKYAEGLGVNYDAAGSAATALTDANAYTDGKIATVDATVAGVKTTAEKGVSDAAAAKSAADAAQAAADAAQGEVDALETYVGTFAHDTAKTVVEYVNAKTAGIATDTALAELTERVAQAEADIDAIEKDYLVEADKTELNGLITTAQEAADKAQGEVDALEQTHATDKAALEAEDARIVGLVEAEAERAAGVEDGLKGRIETMEAFWAAAQADGTDSNVIDTLKEIQEYIAGDETGASEMAASIKQNADAISAMDTAYKAADVALDERLDVLEAIDHEAYKNADTALKNELNGEIAKKADASALTAAIEALEGADTGLGNRIAALEAKHGNGEGTVESLIAAAKQEAIDAAAGDATSKANAAEAAAKGHANGLNTAMDARVVALEAIDHDHANKAELDLIASGDKTKWDTAAGKAHEHANKTVLDGITAENITTWNTVTSKAAQADLTAVGDRVTAIETWHSNFVEVSEEEINKLFA